MAAWSGRGVDDALEGLPTFAAWRFVDAVAGTEVLFPEPGRLRGHTCAVEDGRPYAVSYVRAADLEVRRLDQTCRRLDERSFSYTSEGGFSAVLSCDRAGLIEDCPGIATRVAPPSG